VLALAARERFRLNLIEAYDQPWKRQLEGTVGGHWGLFDAYRRHAKFTFGGAVSDHPAWRWQAGGGIALAAAVFAAAFAGRRRGVAVGAGEWLRVASIAVISGALIGWTVANVPLESLTVGDWLRSLAWAAAALLTPVAGAAAVTSGTPALSFAQMLGRGARPPDRLALALGALVLVLGVLSVAAALGLVFDPRYRDFPFAPLTGAAIPLLAAARWGPWRRLWRSAPAAEAVMAAALAGSAVYIALNEGFANWQALWFSAGLLLFAFTLLRAPDAPGKGS
jgi:hypothetical protein